MLPAPTRYYTLRKCFAQLLKDAAVGREGAGKRAGGRLRGLKLREKVRGRAGHTRDRAAIQ